MAIRIGTRASTLARWQAEWVAARLQENGVAVQLVPISTTGDVHQGSLAAIGGQGLFTKEIQRALAENRIDLAVHSLKDLPTGNVPGLCLAAVPERGPVADVLVLREASNDWTNWKPGTILGTGSLRRRAQLLHMRPDLQMRDIRGNIETRLRKLFDGEFDALVLAEAGLRRLGLEKHITAALPLDVMLPAIGQGALGLETRENDTPTRSCLIPLDHLPTHAAVLAERALLAALQGGCLAPVAAFACLENHRLVLKGRVISIDGSRRIEAAGETIYNMAGESPDNIQNAALQLGHGVADDLLRQGAADLIEQAHSK